jgi:hypothetical protein
MRSGALATKNDDFYFTGAIRCLLLVATKSMQNQSAVGTKYGIGGLLGFVAVWPAVPTTTNPDPKKVVDIFRSARNKSTNNPVEICGHLKTCLKKVHKIVDFFQSTPKKSTIISEEKSEQNGIAWDLFTTKWRLFIADARISNPHFEQSSGTLYHLFSIASH